MARVVVEEDEGTTSIWGAFVEGVALAFRGGFLRTVTVPGNGVGLFISIYSPCVSPFWALSQMAEKHEV